MGNYMIWWQQGMLPTAGSHALSVKISGTAVSGTPATVIITPGAAVASKTLIYDEPGAGGVVGTSISFSLQERDNYGNNVATGTFSFSATLLPINVEARVRAPI